MRKQEDKYVNKKRSGKQMSSRTIPGGKREVKGNGCGG